MKKFSSIISVFFLISIFLFTGCENFLSGSALVAELESAINYANAAVHPVRVRADEDTGTITTDRNKQLKVSDWLEVGFQPAKGYKFLRWEAVNQDDNSVSMASFVEIDAPLSLETKIQLTKESDSILIKESVKFIL